MSTKSKGALWERIAEKTLEMVFGLRVHTTERKMIRTSWGGWMSLSNDFFGCIDHLGTSLEGKTWFVQTTVDSGIGKKAAEIRLIPWNLRHQNVEIWRGVGGKKGKKWDRTHKPEDGVEVDKWFFQRYRLENDFKMVKGDVVVIPPEVLEAVLHKKKPKCACGKTMKKALEIKIGKCAACIRSQVPSVGGAP